MAYPRTQPNVPIIADNIFRIFRREVFTAKALTVVTGRKVRTRRSIALTAVLFLAHPTLMYLANIRGLLPFGGRYADAKALAIHANTIVAAVASAACATFKFTAYPTALAFAAIELGLRRRSNTIATYASTADAAHVVTTYLVAARATLVPIQAQPLLIVGGARAGFAAKARLLHAATRHIAAIALPVAAFAQMPAGFAATIAALGILANPAQFCVATIILRMAPCGRCHAAAKATAVFAHTIEPAAPRTTHTAAF